MDNINVAIAGSCSKQQNIKGDMVTWEFRLERKSRRTGVAEQQQLDVTQVSEIYENGDGLVSVKFTAVPAIFKHMYKAPTKPVDDFRQFFLSDDLQTIYGVGDWMTGETTTEGKVDNEDVASLLVDINKLIEEDRNNGIVKAHGTAGKGATLQDTVVTVDAGSLAPRPPGGATTKSGLSTTRGKSQKHPAQKPKSVLSEEDVALLSKMNSMKNYQLNPRSLPPSVGPRQKKEHEPLWKHPTAEIKVRKTLVMNKAQPTDTMKTAADDRIFSASPSELVFRDVFCPGDVFEVPLVITNKDKVCRRCRLVPPAAPSTPFTLTTLTTPPPNGLLAPGMSMRYLVKFAPKKLISYCDKIIVATEWSEFGIPITATREAPVVTTELKTLVFSCFLGTSTDATVAVTNHGGWAEFNLSIQRNDGCDAVIETENFALAKGETTVIPVKLTPSFLGAVGVELRLASDEGSVEEILPLTSKAVNPDLTVPELPCDESGMVPIEFGEASVYGMLTKTLTVHNNSAVPTKCKWLCEAYSEADEPIPGVFAIDTGSAEDVLEVPANSTLSCDLAFQPSVEGVFHGTARLVALDVPPFGDDASHPFYGKDFDDDGTLCYSLTLLKLTGSATLASVEISPNVIATYTPVLAQAASQRHITLANHGTKEVRFLVDPPKSDKEGREQAKEKKLYKHAQEVPFNARETERGMSLVFNPARGVIPPKGKITVGVTFTSIVTGRFDVPVDIKVDCNGGELLQFVIQGEAVAPQLLATPSVISFINDGVISTSLSATGRGVDQKLNVTNPSDIPVAYLVYCYKDQLRMEEQLRNDPDANVAPLFRYEPEVDFIQPKESRQITLSFFPPPEPCFLQEKVSLIAAPVISQCGGLVDGIVQDDIVNVLRGYQHELDEGAEGEPGPYAFLLEAMAIVLGCLPSQADTIAEVIENEPRTVLHHLKSVNVARRGVKPTDVNKAGILSSNLLLRVVENEAAMGRLDYCTREIACLSGKVACWAKFASAFIRSLVQSKIDFTVEAEVQSVKCRMTPSKIKMPDVMYRGVASTTEVTIRNVCALDASFQWGMLDEYADIVDVVAEPMHSVVPAGSSVVCTLCITPLVTGKLDVLLPVAIREARGGERGAENYIACNILSDEVKGLSVSLSNAEGPAETDPAVYCRHLVDSMVAKSMGAGEADLPLLLPDLDFGTIDLFASKEKNVMLRHHKGSDVDFDVAVQTHSAPEPAASDAPSLLTTSKRIALEKPQTQGFTSANGRKKASQKLEHTKKLQHASAMLLSGKGLAVETPTPYGALSNDCPEALLPFIVHGDLPGDYQDTVVVSMPGSGAPDARIPLSCTVRGQMVKLSENVPGLALPADRPPVLSFPVCLSSPQLKRTKFFKVENPMRLDVELVWTVHFNKQPCEVKIGGDGAVSIEPSETMKAAGCEISIDPQKVVVPSQKSCTFQVHMKMDKPGKYEATMTCQARTASTLCNIQALRTACGDAEVSKEELLARRWAQEEKHSLPVDVDVVAGAVDNHLTPDQSLMQFKCKGAPAPFDPKSDGFLRTLRLCNELPAAQDFRIACDAPFEIKAFTVQRDEEVHRTARKCTGYSDDILFQLRSGDALELNIELPWDQYSSTQNYAATVGRSKGYSSAKSELAASQHRNRGHVAHQDCQRVDGQLHISYPNGNTQDIPLLAVVNYPAIQCTPASLIFGSRALDRKSAWSKRFFIKTTTSAPVQYRIVHDEKFRPITKVTSGHAQGELLKSVMKREAQKQLQGSSGADEVPIDEPDVFTFDSTEGYIPGGENGEVVQPVVVTFTPRGTSHFESVFKIEVDGGRGCEITLRGVSTEAEYGVVAMTSKLKHTRMPLM
eukprot:TRINITY_DN6833_c0_g1_i1.p1 TRINITY_DN6833_c0_g1~~TRINITY_DN6833_c0_g1_i1.p1  ORF type:complete len:2170 (+),score=858.79 TRINITY_DN6833_c0_g1_i1:976-6510(+)